MSEAPCPMCGSWNTSVVDLRATNGTVAIMCWSVCGMDFDVNGIWYMLNRREQVVAQAEEE